MLTLPTIDATIGFARKALGTEGASIFRAQKPSGRFVIAERIPKGSSGETYNREGKFEQSWEAKEDCWLVTACDSDGNTLMAADGQGVEHVNAWPMGDAAFEERYGAANVGRGGVVEAKSIPQLFVRLDASVGVPEDGVMVHQSWGVDEFMSQGSVLNVEHIDEGEVYAIDPVFFAENYEMSDGHGPDVDQEPSFPSLGELRARARDGLDHLADAVRSGIDGLSWPGSDGSDKGLGE